MGCLTTPLVYGCVYGMVGRTEGPGVVHGKHSNSERRHRLTDPGANGVGLRKGGGATLYPRYHSVACCMLRIGVLR